MRWLGRYLVQQFYGRLAWAYDLGALAISGGLWYRWVLAAEHYISAEPVLEVGCGTGHLLERLARQGRNVIGVDLSPQMVTNARRRLRRCGLRGCVLRGDASCLPLTDGSIGTVVTTMPADYALQEAAWREFARVLRPGGRWVIVPGPRIERFHLRLAGLYFWQVIVQGRRAPHGRAGTSGTIPTSLFARQTRELRMVDSVPVLVVILGK